MFFLFATLIIILCCYIYNIIYEFDISLMIDYWLFFMVILSMYYDDYLIDLLMLI